MPAYATRESSDSHHETSARCLWIARRVMERGWAERNNHLDQIDHTAMSVRFLSLSSPLALTDRRDVGIRWHLIDGVEKSAKQDEVKIAAGRTRLEIAFPTHQRPSLR